MTDREFDLICIGRAAVDLYGEQIGSRLEDVQTFAKYLGGSSANIATGSSRQGLKTAMLTRVGDEHMGRFVRESLAAEGVDVSHVVTDPKRLTGLVILGIKDRDTFPLIFYRENCADMNINTSDFDADFIGSSRAIVITGTHFSTREMKAVCETAVRYAEERKTKTILDIDYRPVLWGLTGHGEGEERYVGDTHVTRHLQSILPLFDLIVGTVEEIHIAGGSTDTINALLNIRKLTQATIVVKRGALGCSIFPGKIPNTVDQGITIYGVEVEVLNVLGAGDAFLSGFLRGWIHGDSLDQCGRYANACGALVVSRHGCTPSMPTKIELDDYLSRAEDVAHPDQDARLNRLHRVTTRKGEWTELCILAFDHRTQFEQLAKECGVAIDKISHLKKLIAKAALKGARMSSGFDGRTGILVDDKFGHQVLETMTGSNWWIGRPVESPGSRPLEFEAGDNIGLRIRNWPQEHIVKCLVFYHPDDDEPIRLRQDQKLKLLYEACFQTNHELLLEVILPSETNPNEKALTRALSRLYDLDIFPDWWKLPALTSIAWEHITEVIQSRDPFCRGVVILGLNEPEEILQEGFRNAASHPLCRGFAIGRSIFLEPSRAWLKGDIDDVSTISSIAENYHRLITHWRNRTNTC